MITAPTSCLCCGGSRLTKLGEDVTETLEVIPRRWKVIETVREKFPCRDCEAISQPSAPFHATLRSYIGPLLLAAILFDKVGQQTPLIPCLRHTSAVAAPASCSRRIAIVCSSLNRDRCIRYAAVGSRPVPRGGPRQSGRSLSARRRGLELVSRGVRRSVGYRRFAGFKRSEMINFKKSNRCLRLPMHVEYLPFP